MQFKCLLRFIFNQKSSMQVNSGDRHPKRTVSLPRVLLSDPAQRTRIINNQLVGTNNRGDASDVEAAKSVTWPLIPGWAQAGEQQSGHADLGSARARGHAASFKVRSLPWVHRTRLQPRTAIPPTSDDKRSRRAEQHKSRQQASETATVSFTRIIYRREGEGSRSVRSIGD